MQHPGIILLEQFMQPRDISQNGLARDLRVPPQRINDIVKGRRSITPDTAMRLGYYFGNPAHFWLEVQNRFDLEQAEESGRAAEISQDVRRPTGDLFNRHGSRQQQIEDVALKVHQLVARKLQEDSKPVLSKAWRNIHKWGWDKESRPAPFMTAWQKLLGQPVERIVKIILSPGEKGALLRSSSPFEGVLNKVEKQQAVTLNRENLEYLSYQREVDELLTLDEDEGEG